MKNLLSDQPIPTCRVLENVSYGKISNQPSRVLESPGFQQALQETGLKEALLAQGIGPEKIAEKIGVLLEASDERGNDDYTAIDKGLKHATAIYGILDPTTQTKPSGNTYNFIFSAEVQSEVKKLDEAIKARLINVKKD